MGRWYADHPTSSVVCERVFASLRNLESPQRRSLKHENLCLELMVKAIAWMTDLVCSEAAAKVRTFNEARAAAAAAAARGNDGRGPVYGVLGAVGALPSLPSLSLFYSYLQVSGLTTNGSRGSSRGAYACKRGAGSIRMRTHH